MQLALFQEVSFLSYAAGVVVGIQGATVVH